MSGDPKMMSYYLEHFCVVKLQQDTTNEEEKNSGFDNDRLESIGWKKSLRSCVQGMVDRCPGSFEDEVVARACRSYQSVIIEPGIPGKYNNKKL